jgi:hypothetical protein
LKRKMGGSRTELERKHEAGGVRNGSLVIQLPAVCLWKKTDP